MSRTVTGYINGRAIWSENEPADGTSGPFRTGGTLVVGSSGPYEASRIVDARVAHRAWERTKADPVALAKHYARARVNNARYRERGQGTAA